MHARVASLPLLPVLRRRSVLIPEDVCHSTPPSQPPIASAVRLRSIERRSTHSSDGARQDAAVRLFHLKSEIRAAIIDISTPPAAFAAKLS